MALLSGSSVSEEAGAGGVGAECMQDFQVDGPQGWFVVSGGVSETAGAGAEASGGTVTVSPNAILESFTPATTTSTA
ncbi:hypothetical protein [Brachybacterium vulturis]|uniref:hypothetical protein n=1 Tax=Brachybacterium vulturis TaxID=2017484 RepID=UPI0037353DB9